MDLRYTSRVWCNKTKNIPKLPALTYFYWSKENITHQCAALKRGIEAVLIENGRHMKYVQKALPLADSIYSNIEWGMLTVSWVEQPFKQYAFARKS